MKSTKEKMKIMTYDQAIDHLSNYVQLVKHLLPAIAEPGRKVVRDSNKVVENKLKQIKS